MERLLKEIDDLLVQGLAGAAVALSFCKRLRSRSRRGSTWPSSTGVVRTQPWDRSARSPRKNRELGRPHHGGADPGQGLPKSPLPEVVD